MKANLLLDLLRAKVTMLQRRFDRYAASTRQAVTEDEVDDAEIALIDAQIELAREQSKMKE